MDDAIRRGQRPARPGRGRGDAPGRAAAGGPGHLPGRRARRAPCWSSPAPTTSPVQEYEELGYKVIIYATTPAIAAVEGIQRAYTNLRDTGHIGIGAAEVATRRAEVEALISLPEYQAVEAATTEREFQDRVGH